jgi:hypothetical protein
MLKLASILGGGLIAATLLTALPAAAAPGGSYRDSCHRIEQRGPFLRAECRNAHGHWRSSRLDLRSCTAPAAVANDNGHLACG